MVSSNYVCCVVLYSQLRDVRSVEGCFIHKLDFIALKTPVVFAGDKRQTVKGKSIRKP
jgi:hypothetical protein